MADKYSLTLKIDELSLKIIKAVQLKVTLAKPIGQQGPNVIWMVFNPIENNTIEWPDEFGIYASPNKTIENGTVISKISEVFPAQDGAYYSFDSSAAFKGPFIDGGAPMPGQYKINNNMPQSSYPKLTFGLEQIASINGIGVNPTPINAIILPAEFSVLFSPLNTILVWLQWQFTSGTIITSVNGDATAVTFGGGITDQTLTYNPITGRFVASSEEGKMLAENEAPHVKILRRPGIY